MAALSTKQAEQFFAECDTDGSGCVSIQELVQKICGNLNSEHDHVVKMFRDVDKDENGQITKPEFIDEVCKQPREEGIKDFFEAADADNSDTISKSELEAILAKAGGKLDASALQEIFDSADADGSGCISLAEFKQAMDDSY